MLRFAIVMTALVGCARAETPPEEPKVAPAPDVGVELAGVTLADDCGDGARTKPLPPPSSGQKTADSASQTEEPAAKRAPAAAESVSAGACAGPGGCPPMPQPACEQTSMQISIKARGQKTKIKIKRVELLDTKGKVVGELTARSPMRWNGSTYVTWNEAVTEDGSVSYKLTAPDWQKLTNGRWNAGASRWQLRVTVTVGDRDRTIDKQSITPALPEPEVAT